MTGFPDSPRLVKGGIVVVDPTTAAVLRVITLQYNPETLTRTLQIQSSTGEGGDRSEALRLKGPAVETLKLDAEIDATDRLETSDPVTVQSGLSPQLAALEMLLYPTVATLLANDAMASSGRLEILPMEAPLTLFVWSANRVVPVRITDFSITEEAFDTQLNPIRAKVSISMRVLSVADLGFAHRGGGIYLAYQRAKETLSTQAPGGSTADLGIGAIP
jgi:Contractile injection system tube protein